MTIRKNTFFVDPQQYKRTMRGCVVVLAVTLPISLAVTWIWFRKPLIDLFGETIGDLLVGYAPLILNLLILYWFSRPLKRYDRRYREGRCLGCGYPRTGAAMDVCPECGRAWTEGREKAESSG
ncbi:MAG TPA: hypothetical protein ENJ00_10215 [Phycisphaerales bacterium]|nr:hypothetical protein [Phycisphaerales bacterium]